MYDFIVIGGGSAGVHTAYFLRSFGAKVALVEKSKIGAGGSGAAGAFVTPRLGKGGAIQRWSNEAFKFAISFYDNFPHFYKTQLLRLPKEKEDFSVFEPYLKEINYQRTNEGFLFLDAGVIKAKEHLEKLAKEIEVFLFTPTIKKRGSYFEVGKLLGKEIILATGSELKLPYVKVGQTSGIRFDLATSLTLPYSLHKKVSLSKEIDGVTILGATHQRPNRPQPPSFLFEQAKEMVGEFNYKLVQMYCGVRSSVDDHLPIVGSLLELSKLKLPKSYKEIELSKLPKSKIHIIGGLGGRGFVFGPFVGKMLSEYLLFDRKIPDELNLNRYLKRYVKRGGK
ncbi:MAG: FAD-binding oxidoreductase [Epsilonproteobacteria bacterium]|nr:FAD-binding oxidoreductase [Campylobacterota bacterium]